MKEKLQIPALAALAIAGLCTIHFFGAQLGFPGDLADHLLPGIVSSRSYLRVIEEKKDLGDVYDAYYTLGRRRSPVAERQALEDVLSEDDYLWLNAGHYLGILERKEAVPYLIKALRHTAWRSDEERVELLQKMTGKTFGANFAAWKNWWLAGNPGAIPVDWESSLGHNPRIEQAVE